MKEQLTQLIETYTAARISGNSTLQQYATQLLSSFLQQVEIIPLPPATPESAAHSENDTTDS